MLGESVGVWLDCFHSDWFTTEAIDALIAYGKKLCIVSSELHNRSTEIQWECIRQCKSVSNPDLMLCTDTPEKADRYFNDTN
jgi:hypothetical protein